MVKTKTKIVIVALVLVALAVTIYQFLLTKSNRITTENAYIQGEITQISAEVSGRIIKVLVEDNQYVKAGDVLALIDDRDYISRYQQALATVRMAEAAIDSNQARIDLQQIKIKEHSAYVGIAQLEHGHQQRELGRYTKLVQNGAISKSEHDGQNTKTKRGSSSLQAYEHQLVGAKQQLKTLEAERAQLIAQKQQLQATLALSQTALQHTKIVAPISGVVGNRALQEGKFINVGMGVLAIVPIDDIWLLANYKETQLTDVEPGQRVRVVLDMYPNTSIDGRVVSISPSTGAKFSLLPPDNSTGNFVKVVQRLPVKIQLNIPHKLSGRVVPGLSANATIYTDQTDRNAKIVANVAGV